MKIRKARLEDAVKISNLIRKCLNEVNAKSYPKKAIKKLCNFFKPSLIIRNLGDRDVFVAIEDGNVLGTASLKGDTVFTVFVNPKIHGKGIGTRLMDKIEELAGKRKYKLIKVPSSLNAFEFYKKRGYKKIKIIRSKDDGDTIKMEKKLK